MLCGVRQPAHHGEKCTLFSFSPCFVPPKSDAKHAKPPIQPGCLAGRTAPHHRSWLLYCAVSDHNILENGLLLSRETVGKEVVRLSAVTSPVRANGMIVGPWSEVLPACASCRAGKAATAFPIRRAYCHSTRKRVRAAAGVRYQTLSFHTWSVPSTKTENMHNGCGAR